MTPGLRPLAFARPALPRLAFANGAVLALALLCAGLDLRLPLGAYVAIALLQAASVVALMVRPSLFSAVAGASITVLLVFAILVESDASIAFGPWYPRRVYRPEIVATAYTVLVLGGSLFFLLTLGLGTRSPWPQLVLAQAHRPRAGQLAWWLLAFGAAAALLTLGAPTIFDAPYPFYGYASTASVQSSGVVFMAVTALGMSLIVGVLAFGQGSRRYKVLVNLVLVLVLWVYLLRGSRGNALPILVTVALIPFLFGTRPIGRRALTLLGKIALLFLLYQLLGTYRWSAAVHGPWEGLGYAWQHGVVALAADDGHRGSDVLKVSTLPQSYWHILQTVDLYASGNRLHGQTFVNVVVQAVPLFVTDFLGLSRPLSESQQLSLYRLHGGGMYAFAIAYWNLGMLGVGLFAALLGLFANWMESWFRRQPPLVIGAYLIAAGMLPYGMLYGWQSMARGLEIALALALVLRLAAQRTESGAYRRGFA